jgi:glycosyltransferase involved in cell wall biosynthesis
MQNLLISPHIKKPKKKIIIFYTLLLHYRLDIFQALAERYDLTVVHSGKAVMGAGGGFSEIVLPVRAVGRFRYQPGLWNLFRRGEFDSAIFFFDLAWISIILAFIFCPNRSRRITWGLWKTRNTLANIIRYIFSRTADANIFYGRGAGEYFRELGLPSKNIFIARNTFHVEVPERDESSKRDCIFFVGSFDERKQNDITIFAFSNLAKKINWRVRLVFVGEGSDKARIMQLAHEQWCADQIEFHHGTTDKAALRCYYSRAICSVSFGQAGLSVLQSFGHGVPFLTRRNAVSGGEIENIINGYNGILCDDSQVSLEHSMMALCADQPKANELGRNALLYYQQNASILAMVSGFVGAIEGASISTTALV